MWTVAGVPVAALISLLIAAQKPGLKKRRCTTTFGARLEYGLGWPMIAARSSAWLCRPLLGADRIGGDDRVGGDADTGGVSGEPTDRVEEAPDVAGEEGPPEIREGQEGLTTQLREGLVEEGFENGPLIFGQLEVEVLELGLDTGNLFGRVLSVLTHRGSDPRGRRD